jgi:hypothetical protein
MAPSASVANGLLRVKFSATFLWFVGIGMLPWPLSLIVSLLACLPSSCSFCIYFTSVYIIRMKQLVGSMFTQSAVDFSPTQVSGLPESIIVSLL